MFNLGALGKELFAAHSMLCICQTLINTCGQGLNENICTMAQMPFYSALTHYPEQCQSIPRSHRGNIPLHSLLGTS